MDVKQLEYLIEIEKQGSISKAADELYISQSALSQCLDKHNKQLKDKIFKKNGKFLNPTKVGQIYLDGAKDIIRIKNEVYKKLEDMANITGKHYSIACDFITYSILMDDVLQEMKSLYPNVTFEVNKVNSNLAKQYLLNNISDVALMCIDKNSNSLLEYLPLFEDELVFCVPKSIKKHSPSSPLILLQNGTLFRTIQDKLLLNSNISPIKMFEVEDFLTAKHLMKQQYGSTFLPKSLVENTDEYTYYSLNPIYNFNIVFSHYKYLSIDEELTTLYELLKLRASHYF